MDGHVYAYHVPPSSEQQAYTQARVAQLAALRRERRESVDISVEQRPASQSQSHSNSNVTPADKPRDSGTYPAPTLHGREASCDGMDAMRSNSESGVSHSLHFDTGHQPPLQNPFELRHGRRYLRDLPYPLPCDLAEVHRQNLRTLLACSVFGKPLCSPSFSNAVPKKVLELGCGSGYWSATAHDYFSARGHGNVSFTGLDIAPVAPDLRKQGVDWRFVQHDIHRLPWPFEDGEFDVVVAHDLSLTMPINTQSHRQLDENIRILREGGTLEIWESDLVIRSLLPQVPGRAKQYAPEREMAERTATFLMAAGAAFAPAANKHLVEANAWITEALDRRRLSPVPCARIAQLLIQEPDLSSIGMRRVAIPLSELQWERDPAAAAEQMLAERSNSTASAIVDSPLSTGKATAATTGAHAIPSSSSLSSDAASSSSSSSSSPSSAAELSVLSPEQLALRQTALITVLQMIESFEPLLKEVSGKNAEEWSNWWASLMSELTDPAKANLSGECLELGAWWATKES